MASLAQWVAGARPRTLPAALSPVIAGTGAAAAMEAAHLGRAVLAMLVSLALQVGVNYANDYSDGIRGTDENRVGPLRLVGSGAATADSVKIAAFTAFGVAAGAGLILVLLCQAWWLIALGALCILAAWYYTGGERPYGYAGLGEVFVFVFFGLVAVLGTTYTQAGRISVPATAAAVGVGALACAILVVNNLRDVPSDSLVGKRTLAVRLGESRTRRCYVALLVLALLMIIPCGLVRPWAFIASAAVVPMIAPIRTVLSDATGSALIPPLGATGKVELLYAALLALGLAL